MGVTAADYDNDGNADLFVCNDVSENFLFHNDGGGKFQQVGLVAGIALNINGEGVANMAVDAGDYNHDGWLDFYVTDYDKQFPLLFQNLGGVFSEVMQSAKAGGLLPARQVGLRTGRLRQRRLQGHFHRPGSHGRQRRVRRLHDRLPLPQRALEKPR